MDRPKRLFLNHLRLSIALIVKHARVKVAFFWPFLPLAKGAGNWPDMLRKGNIEQINVLFSIGLHEISGNE